MPYATTLLHVRGLILTQTSWISWSVFRLSPSSIFKEAMALKWSLNETNGLKSGKIYLLKMESAISKLFFVILQLLRRRNYILTEPLCGNVEAILTNTCNAVTFYNPLLRMPLFVSQTRNLHFFLLEYGQWIAPDVSQRTNLFGCAFGSINWNWTTKTLSSICRIQLNTCIW